MSKKLLDIFPPVSNDDWKAKILQDLKGADYDKKLVWNTVDGLKVQPFYREDDMAGLGAFAELVASTRKNQELEVRHAIRDLTNLKVANRDILYWLDRGVNSLEINVPDKDLSKDELLKLLDNVFIDAVPLHFITGANAAGLLKSTSEIAGDKGLDRTKLQGSVDFDPVGNLVDKGYFYSSLDQDMEDAKQLLDMAKDHLPGFLLYKANGNSFKEAGASVMQELAYTLATGADYLHYLSEKGLDVLNIASKIQFVFSPGSSYFLEIAKLRAARILWQQIVRSYANDQGLNVKMYIHNETLQWNKSVLDPHTNILRQTSETMSAVCGGTDSIMVRPFDELIKESTNFSKRVAKNIPILLKEEAYFDKANPADGSYYIEKLTGSLLEGAWEMFTGIEAKGGFIAMFQAGEIQKNIAGMAEKRRQNAASRKEIYVGANKYANLMDQHLKSVSIEPGQAAPKAETDAIPLEKFRVTANIENIRLMVESMKPKPSVFLLTIGDLTMRKARAGFSYDFFACAGFEVIDNNGFESVDQGLAAAREKGAAIIVLCSSDDEYAELGPRANSKILENEVLVIAGYPKNCIKDLENAGVKHFIHLRSNLEQELTKFLELVTEGLAVK